MLFKIKTIIAVLIDLFSAIITYDYLFSKCLHSNYLQYYTVSCIFTWCFMFRLWPCYLEELGISKIFIVPSTLIYREYNVYRIDIEIFYRTSVFQRIMFFASATQMSPPLNAIRLLQTSRQWSLCTRALPASARSHLWGILFS